MLRLAWQDSQRRGALHALCCHDARVLCMDIIQQKCCEGLGALRSSDVLPTLLAQTKLGKGGFTRRAAMRAMAALGSERRGGDVRMIRERLVELLDDPDFRVRVQAIASLESLGDPSSCGALQAVVDEGFDNQLKRRSREAVRNLREGRAAPEQLAQLRAESELLWCRGPRASQSPRRHRDGANAGAKEPQSVSRSPRPKASTAAAETARRWQEDDCVGSETRRQAPLPPRQRFL
ncbi:MAG: HEAT repeat domain-containing protein [Myxococcales bacterium]|nr:HEAT repeat domain-containing protein [Myxococcales bacterium]